MKKKFKIGIIGFGNIGKKRFLSILKIKNYTIEIVYIVDKALKKDKILKSIDFFKNWEKVKSIDVDLVIVATPTKISEKIVKEFSGKFNLLVEKPITTKLTLMSHIVNNANKNKLLLKTGYNLRFDDGLQVAKNIMNKNKIGKIYYCKITYANGTTKTNSNQVGSLLDMGSHSLNLLEWFFENSKITPSYNVFQSNEFMNKSKVDNGFVFLKINKIICMMHHGFCTWKNKFNLEISGSKGYISVNSLSKWGDQKVTLGVRKYPSGIPLIKKWSFSYDNSWKNELLFVIKKIVSSSFDYTSVNKEGYNTLKLIKKLTNGL